MKSWFITVMGNLRDSESSGSNVLFMMTAMLLLLLIGGLITSLVLLAT